jgi:uncharacterized protein
LPAIEWQAFMDSLVYLHGFLSSPSSFKAVQLKAWLGHHHPDITYHCPLLTPYPHQTQQQLERLVESLLPQRIFLMGSSLGGFWATWLVEKYDLPALLINPAVKPHDFMPKYLGIELKNFHTEDTYCLSQKHLDEILKVDRVPLRKDNYWLLLQTGDETLDYRDAVQKYSGCKQTLEQGGDHSFQGIDRYFDDALSFYRASR